MTNKEKQLHRVLERCVTELERLHYLHARPGAMFEGKVGAPNLTIIRRGRKILELKS